MTELIAYLHGRHHWQASDIPGSELTYLNYAFAKIDGLKIADNVPNINRLSEIRAAYPKLKINISIGGWGAEGFSDAVSSPENREIFATNILAFVEHYHFNGVDLDWEYPGSSLSGIKTRTSDIQNFQLFLQILKQKLISINKHYVLTAAVGADFEIINRLAINQRATYAESLDFVNVMTYDLRGSWTSQTGHQTNLYPYHAKTGKLSADQAIKHLLMQGVPAQKLVLGAAIYSRDWVGFDSLDSNTVEKQAQSKGNQVTAYEDVRPLLIAHPENYYWDDRAKAAYYFDGKIFMSFDDPQSIRFKAEYVIDQGLGGLMFWEQTLDSKSELIGVAAAIIRNRNN